MKFEKIEREPVSPFTLLTSNFQRLAGVLDSMTVFETVGQGSIPGRVTRLLSEPIMFSECAGFARDFAKVVDQVRFLARALKKGEERS